jgi:hypothetical protein
MCFQLTCMVCQKLFLVSAVTTVCLLVTSKRKEVLFDHAAHSCAFKACDRPRIAPAVELTACIPKLKEHASKLCAYT